MHKNFIEALAQKHSFQYKITPDAILCYSDKTKCPYGLHRTDSSADPFFGLTKTGILSDPHWGDPKWCNMLEGAILMAFVQRKQIDYVLSAGGYDNIREADNGYNDLNRELIATFAQRYGKAYLVRLNFYGRQRSQLIRGEVSAFQEYTGQFVGNFDYDFLLSSKNDTLQCMIRDWNKEKPHLAELPKSINKITALVEKLGGIPLLWY